MASSNQEFLLILESAFRKEQENQDITLNEMMQEITDKLKKMYQGTSSTES